MNQETHIKLAELIAGNYARALNDSERDMDLELKVVFQGKLEPKVKIAFEEIFWQKVQIYQTEMYVR